MFYNFKVQKFSLNSDITKVLNELDDRFFDVYYVVDKNSIEVYKQYYALRNEFYESYKLFYKNKVRHSNNLVRYHLKRMNEKLDAIDHFFVVTLLKQ